MNRSPRQGWSGSSGVDPLIQSARRQHEGAKLAVVQAETGDLPLVVDRRRVLEHPVGIPEERVQVRNYRAAEDDGAKLRGRARRIGDAVAHRYAAGIHRAQSARSTWRDVAHRTAGEIEDEGVLEGIVRRLRGADDAAAIVDGQGDR